MAEERSKEAGSEADCVEKAEKEGSKVGPASPLFHAPGKKGRVG